METVKRCGNNYVKQEICEMSQIRRKSTGSKGITSQTSSKNQNTEVINEEKSLDKQETSTSAKSTKITGVPQTTTRQPSIREQLKPKPKSTKSNKCTRDKDNLSPQKSPPKKRIPFFFQIQSGFSLQSTTRNSFLTHNHYKTRSIYRTVTSKYTSVRVFYTIHVPYLTFRARTLSM